jgi:transcriptional regulator with XRE-family HTH domain
MIMLAMNNRRGSDEETVRAIGARIAIAKAQSRYAEETLVVFGKRFKVSYQSAKNWLDGKKLPGSENLISLAKLLNISLDWLLLNRGSMRPSEVKGETVFIGHWPENAKGVVRGLASVYDGEAANQDGVASKE